MRISICMLPTHLDLPFLGVASVVQQLRQHFNPYLPLSISMPLLLNTELEFIRLHRVSILPKSLIPFNESHLNCAISLCTLCWKLLTSLVRMSNLRVFEPPSATRHLLGGHHHCDHEAGSIKVVPSCSHDTRPSRGDCLLRSMT